MQRSMSHKYGPASEPLRISVNWLFLLQARAKEKRAFGGMFEAGAPAMDRGPAGTTSPQ